MPTLIGTTFSGFTRPTDPISMADLGTKISADIGKAVTVVVTGTDILVTGLTLVSGDGSGIQTSISAYMYVPLQFPSNASLYADDDNTLSANSGTRIPTQRAIKGFLNGKIRRTYFNGAAQTGTPNTGDVIEWIDSVTTTSGNAVFYLTSDHTAAGTALCSAIYAPGADATTVDATGAYPRGVAIVSVDLKSVTIPFNKQTFSGVVVATINVLGSVTFSNAPNGTTVNATIIGIAA